MKMKQLWSLMAVMLISITAVMGSCAGKQAASGENDSIQAIDSIDSIASGDEAYVALIEKYLVDSIGSQYSPGEMCIPVSNVIDVDDSDSTDVKVWGSFWVFNYNLSGDTLKTVSGGSHPGLFHLNVASNAWKITSFDKVGDGSNYLPTAKKIFGDKLEAFQKIESSDKQHDTLRTQAVSAYVKKHNIAATMYQDYGWPPVKLTE